jgi:peptidoglycan/xylan/chitin deacetylase (PgdA/CDA1 family)
MRKSASQSRRTIISVFLLIFVLSISTVTVLLKTIVRDQQQEHENPGLIAGPTSPGHGTALQNNSRQRPHFRFPRQPSGTEARDHEWYILEEHNSDNNGPRSIAGSLQHRMLHFTFDDGPYAETTPELLNILSAYNVHATFFVVGKHLFGPDSRLNSDILRRAAKDGHTIGIHSYTHKDFRYLSNSQINRELYRTGRLLKNILGYHPRLFRPPYGGRNLTTKAQLKVRGYIEILWNIAPEEYSAKSPREILGNFQAALDRQDLNGKWPGGIVLLHDNRDRTVQGLPLLMEELRRRNCILLHQDGQELWDVVDDLSYFMLYGDQLPDELVGRRQFLARRAAEGYCNGSSQEKYQVITEQYAREHAG